MQEKLRALGFHATNVVLTNDNAGDARLIGELERAAHDFGGSGRVVTGRKCLTYWPNNLVAARVSPVYLDY